MITEYKSGSALVEHNQNFLNTNPYLTSFFVIDAPLLGKTDHTNYALACESEDKKLLAMKVEPYNLLLFGDSECVPELLTFLWSGGYVLGNYLCESGLGDAVANELQKEYHIRYREALAMDFMEADQETEPSSTEVIPATENDFDEICQCTEHFIADCGLLDSLNREGLKRSIGSFRVIKANGQIVSMAKMAASTCSDIRITNVYTRDAYRGQGLARKVVNTLKNEILSQGKKATLNVDKNNPVSYHLYSSLGFRRLFSQSEYRKEK